MFEKIISKNPEDAANQRQAAPQLPGNPPVAAPQAQQPAQTAAATPTAAPVSASPSPSTGGQRNVLSNDVHIKGTVRFTNDLLVDGRIEGEISSEGALTVAENAHIKAEVKTKSVVIYGKVHGNIACTDKVEIKSSAEMVGDVKAGILSIEPGAIFVGKSEVGTPSAAPRKENPSDKNKQGNQQQNKKPQGKPGGNNNPKNVAKAS